MIRKNSIIIKQLVLGSAVIFAVSGCDISAETPFESSAQELVDLNAPTTLVSVQTDASGKPVLRYVRGETAYSNGGPMSEPQPVGLETLSTFGPENAPSALRYEGIIAVARRVGNTIHFNSSGYATRLADDADTPAPSRIVLTSDSYGSIDSRVQLARIKNSLLIAWRSGSTLRAIASQTNGLTWSAPYTLATMLAVNQDFALASDLSGASDTVLIAIVSKNGSYRYVVPLWLVSPTSTSQQPAFQSALLPSSMTYSGTEEIRGISVAKNGDKVFVAYARDKKIDIARYSFSTRAYETSSTIVDLTGLALDLRGVTIHPSPYGWACQSVITLNSSGTVYYLTLNQLSDDGLTYSSATMVSNGMSTSNVGPVSMTLTPVPTPWIWKYQDSGRYQTAAYNLVITGDGYTYPERTAFFDQAKVTADHILSLSPISENRKLFNIWIIAAYSKESGNDTRIPVPTCNVVQQEVDTIFDSYTCNGTDFAYRLGPGRHSRRMLSGLAPWSPTTPPVVRTIGLVNKSYIANGGVNRDDGSAIPVGSMPNPDTGHRMYASLVPAHEGLHGNLFAHPDFIGTWFALDQDLAYEYFYWDQTRTTPIDTSNTFGSSTHPWWYWFTSGLAPSSYALLSDDYRARRNLGLVNCGAGVYAWFFADPSCTTLETTNHPAYKPGSGCTLPVSGLRASYCKQMESPDASNPFTGNYQINALSYFNPGMFEVQDLQDYSGSNRWYTLTYAGFMYSRYHHSYFIDPATADGIVESLERWATGSYASANYRNAGGATLQVHLQRWDTVFYGSPSSSTGTERDIFPWGSQGGCRLDYGTSLASLEALGSSFEIQVGSTTYHLSNMTLNRWDDGKPDSRTVATLKLPDVSAGTTVSITFRSTNTNPSAPPAWLWIPGIQIVNERGDRYAMQPASAHVAALQAKKPGDCNFEAWDLQANGPFTITYVSKGLRSQ